MTFNAIFDNEDAVSPVIGVILMVAITVILAAVIATFVLGLGEQVSQTSPQASFSFSVEDADDQTTSSFVENENDFDNDYLVTITHAGGASIDAPRLSVVSESGEDGPFTNGGYGDGSLISAGDRITVGAEAGDEVRVTWQSEDGRNSATLSTFTVPN